MSKIIRMKPLVKEGTVEISGFAIDKKNRNWGMPPEDVYETAPILPELRHAFTNEEIRRDIFENKTRGEWTSTFLRNTSEVIERPEKVRFDKKKDLWVIEGGQVYRVDLPPNGWALNYDQRGFPTATGSKEEAERIFGEDASYFAVNRLDGLRPVWRDYGWYMDIGGPFCVVATWDPSCSSRDIGSRSVYDLNGKPINERTEDGIQGMSTGELMSYIQTWSPGKQ